MGVKRFLVAGGMASLVLIGVVLIVAAEGLAQNGMNPQGFVKDQCNQFPDLCQGGQKAVKDPQGFVKDQCNQFPDLCQGGQGGENNGGEPGGGAPTGGEPGGGAPTGGEPGGGVPTGGEPGGGAPAGAAGGDMAPVSFVELPPTGGPSVVLLLASALLLGSALLLVAYVRSVRS